MKKAKVIIPSLALLSFSALACVTGSVAWFSSITQAQVATSSFGVKAIVGTMNISVTQGVATRIGVTTSETVEDKYKVFDGDNNLIGYKNREDIIVNPAIVPGTASDPSQLSHGSYNCATQTAFTFDSSASGAVRAKKVSDKPQTTANEQYYREQGAIDAYNIFTWNMEFEYDWSGATSGTKNLYLDLKSIAFTKHEDHVAGKADSAYGFRIAFITLKDDDSTLDWTVISPFQDKEFDLPSGTESCYVASPSETAKYDPSVTGNLIYSPSRNGTTFDISGVESAGYNDRKDCVGQFDASTAVNSKSKIRIKVVCWYEGEDGNVIFQTVYNQVSANPIKFIVADDLGKTPKA